MSETVISIGADHRGFALKAHLLGWLGHNGYAPKDLGTHSTQRCDALDYVQKLMREFRSNSIEFGILICGSGQAMAMTANRYQRLRAALCGSVPMTKREF